MGFKYQTKTQVMLDILLEDAMDELYLSCDRLAYLKKINDMETYHLEKTANIEYYNKKVVRIRELIDMEKGSSSSHKEIVHTGFFSKDDVERISGYYASEVISLEED